MINKQFDNLIERMKAIKLTSSEKSEIFSRTFSVIDGIEAATAAKSVPTQVRFDRPVASPLSSVAWSAYINNRKFVPSLVIVAILFVTGGTSLAAETSLPGDPLYGLKINVNEAVRGLAAVTPESKARVAVEASGQRLQEAATLSARGQLTDENKSIVQQEFQKQADQVQTQVASLVSQNNLAAAQEVAVDYESSLKAHEIILEKISDDESVATSTQHLSSLIDTVKTELATSTVSRVDIQAKQIETTADPKAASEQEIVDVRNMTDDTINMRIENLDSLSTTTAALIAGDIIEAQVLTVKAQGYMASSSYPDALMALQKASTVLSDAQGAISVEAGLDTDVKKVIGVPSGSPQSTATSTTTATTTISDASVSDSSSTSTEISDSASL